VYGKPGVTVRMDGNDVSTLATWVDTYVSQAFITYQHHTLVHTYITAVLSLSYSKPLHRLNARLGLAPGSNVTLESAFNGMGHTAQGLPDKTLASASNEYLEKCVTIVGTEGDGFLGTHQQTER
jgi:hypothetical protein